MIDEEMYIHVPRGSLWIRDPSYARSVSAREWRDAHEFIQDLLPLGDYISGGCTIALSDALERTREELKRTQERESAEKDEHGRSAGEAARLMELIRCCDELVNARTMIEDHVSESLGGRASTLDMLIRLHEDMHDEFMHYRRELGFPEPPKGGRDDV